MGWYLRRHISYSYGHQHGSPPNVLGFELPESGANNYTVRVVATALFLVILPIGLIAKFGRRIWSTPVVSSTAGISGLVILAYWLSHLIPGAAHWHEHPDGIVGLSDIAWWLASMALMYASWRKFWGHWCNGMILRPRVQPRAEYQTGIEDHTTNNSPDSPRQRNRR